jgi:hypothetical protein
VPKSRKVTFEEIIKTQPVEWQLAQVLQFAKTKIINITDGPNSGSWYPLQFSLRNCRFTLIGFRYNDNPHHPSAVTLQLLTSRFNRSYFDNDSLRFHIKMLDVELGQDVEVLIHSRPEIIGKKLAAVSDEIIKFAHFNFAKPIDSIIYTTAKSLYDTDFDDFRDEE